MTQKEIPVVEDFSRLQEEGVEPELLTELTFSTAKWGIFAAAVENGIFERLRDKPLTSDQVARSGAPDGCDPVLTHYVLDALAGLRLLRKNRQEETYALTPTARFFLGSWGFMRPSTEGTFWNRLSRMLRGERLDPPPGFQAGRYGPDWSQEAIQRYMALRALGGEFHQTCELLERTRIFERARRLLDLAGGHGLFAIGFLKRYPALEAAILELPEVLPVTAPYLKAYGLEGRIPMMAGDVYKDPIPEGFDVIFVSNLSPPRSAVESLFCKIYEALPEGGVFVYKDIVPRKDWSEAFYPLAHKLLITTSLGDSRYCGQWPPTAQEARAAMKAVGFRRTRFLGWIDRWCTVSAGWKL